MVEYHCDYCGKDFMAAAYTPGAAPTRCPDEAQHDNRITRAGAVKKIKASMGRFFTIVFTKRTTGEERKMTCRLGVSKHLKGGKKAYDPEKLGLMIVWEPKSAEYKSIPTDAITELRIQGKSYLVAG